MVNGEFRENDLKTGLETAFGPGGIMETVAQAALEQPAELRPDDIADIILPPRAAGESLAPRWQLVEAAKASIQEAANAHKDEILALAERLGMRHDGVVTESDVSRINPGLAVWVVEGGANRTSVVRRTLAIEAMQLVYSDDYSQQQLFQLGSDRRIPRERNGKPNAEFTIAEEIANDFLPDGDLLTEFGLNLASALQSGYEVVSDEEYLPAAKRVVGLHKDGLPGLTLIQPAKTEMGGLEDGFSAVNALVGSGQGRQFVIATNGQYRPKDEAQALQWASARDFDMLPPVALGDEPGYTVSHNGREITTAQRAPMVYVNEIVVLRRLTSSN